MIKPYFETENGILYQGNALDILKDMDPESIDCVMTSPPYWALRDYGIEPIIWDGDGGCLHIWENDNYVRNTDKTAGIKQKTNKGSVGRDEPVKSAFCGKCGAWKGSLGLEPTFQLYIQHLIQIFDEIKRILKKTGTCWVNIGDTYGGSAGGYHSHKSELGASKQQIKRKNSGFEKSLLQIPERFSIAMTDRGWIKRNSIIWFKSNCMPSSANDRFTVDFEYLYFFTKSPQYWFEQQFKSYTAPLNRWGGPVLKKETEKHNKYLETQNIGASSALRTDRPMRPNEQGRNKRCVWKISTQSFPEAHFAVYPEQLCYTPIKAGCPEYICKKCRKPREKVYDRETTFHSGSGKSGNIPEGKWKGGEQEISGDYDIRMGPHVKMIEKGYTDCGCGQGFKPGIVLDPFAGAGTTLLIAEKLRRKYIGIEISKEYCDIAVERIKKETAQYKMDLTYEGGGEQ